MSAFVGRFKANQVTTECFKEGKPSIQLSGVVKNFIFSGFHQQDVCFWALWTFEDAEVTQSSSGTSTQLPDPRTFTHRTLLTCITLRHTHTQVSFSSDADPHFTTTNADDCSWWNRSVRCAYLIWTSVFKKWRKRSVCRHQWRMSRTCLQVEASRASSPTTAAVCSSVFPELPAELRSEDETDDVRFNVSSDEVLSVNVN